MITVPTLRRPLVVLTVLYGLAFFVWLGEEDSVQYVTALGVGLAALFVAHSLARQFGGRALDRRRWIAVTALGGLILGVGSAVATATLMAIKVSIHGHIPGVLDYPPEAVLQVLSYTPVWASAGVLAGLGFGLIVWSVLGAQGSVPRV